MGYKKCMIATDNENAVKVFARRVKANCSADVSLRTRPKGSPASLGGGETAVQIIAGGLRTPMSELEQRIGERVPVTCRVIPWMFSHVAFCRSRFNKASDNSTPYFRVNGNHYSGNMTNFGDAVLNKTYDGDSKLRSKWKRGVRLGKSEFNDSAFVSTNTGVVSGRSFKVLPSEQLTSEMILKLIGVPWEPLARLAEYNGQLAIPGVRVALAGPPVPIHISDDEAGPDSSSSSSDDDAGGMLPHNVQVPASPILGGSETPVASRPHLPGTPPETGGATSSGPAAEPAAAAVEEFTMHTPRDRLPSTPAPISPGTWRKIRDGQWNMVRTPPQVPRRGPPEETGEFEHDVKRTKHDNDDGMCVDFEEYLVTAVDMAEFQRQSDEDAEKDSV